MSRVYFKEIQQGKAYKTDRRTITEADIVNFAGISGDFNPLHMDDLFAHEETPFGRRIAHGLLGVSVGSGLSSEMDEWYVLAFLETHRRFELPIFPGDTIHIEAVVASKRRSESKPDRGVVVVEVQLLKQDGTVAQTGEDVFLVGDVGE